ncbi:BLUF domain-containing protein [Spirosoma soli]|uniref:BLUF domain-containing protein n=1 Tax=Spirosoma soli TaxID=1770529 RepID=A0ABW5M5W8_9BACT
MEHCIVYFSSSVDSFQEEDLLTILQQSRQNNLKHGITGVMLYVRGSILQVLEGEKEAVETLYKRIKQDKRHKEVIMVLNRPITQRLFPTWSMAYETITVQQLDDIKSIIDLDKKEESAATAEDHIILRTIKLFYESNRHN